MKMAVFVYEKVTFFWLWFLSGVLCACGIPGGVAGAEGVSIHQAPFASSECQS